MTSIEVIGADGVHRMLQAYTDPTLTKRMAAATKAGAQVFGPPLTAEARTVSRRLAKSVSVRAGRRDKPSAVVTFRPKIAWFRHFIIGGTKAHGPRKARLLAFIPNWNPYFSGGPPAGASQVRTAQVRGVAANPIVDRVADRYTAQAYAAIDRALDQSETSR